MIAEDYSGNFPCSKFNCTRSNCSHYLKCDEIRSGFPFELVELVGEGGFATVFRGSFHDGEAAFKFVPVDLDGYKYENTSVGIYEYHKQEKINKIIKFDIKKKKLSNERKDPSTQIHLEHASGQTVCLFIRRNG